MRSQLGMFGRSLIVAAVACVGSSLSGAASAGELVEITIDFAKILKLDREADTIIIGNPGIADASVSDEETLILTGKTAGTTNLIALDNEGREIVNATVKVSSDIRELTTVFYGAERQTFSCAPVCEQVISVGDNRDTFDTAKEQIQTRRQFATGQ